MDSLVKSFENTELGFNIQSIRINDDIYFKGKAVAATLGYSHTGSAIQDHVRATHKNTLEQIITAAGEAFRLPQLTYNEKQTIYITELGLYGLALKSRLPAIEQFQDWVYSVIKTIRQTGSCSLQPKPVYDPINPFNLDNEDQMEFVFSTLIRKYYPSVPLDVGVGELYSKFSNGKKAGYTKGTADITLAILMGSFQV